MTSNQGQTNFGNQGQSGFTGLEKLLESIQDQKNFGNQGYSGFRDGDDEINPKFTGIWGGNDQIKATGSHQLRGFPNSNSNSNNRFDVGESRLAKIKAKISVEDFDYLKGFANSDKIIDEKDPRLVKIRAKISAEDVDYLKGLANKRFGGNNTGFASGRTASFHGARPRSFNCWAPPGGFDNNVTIGGCVFL
ncbi:unnamed protein product [Prunus armeniaca]|uniref:Uncharacterized protein n=1 Tax=Prunus armeniaca TaxID=36596 RepID=A0A6J5VWC7_PRUAR|nr:unnamed protein product [Prunus armeniaca]CAB4292182.1 unnamed protein product [Prunus armeniaca]